MFLQGLRLILEFPCNSNSLCMLCNFQVHDFYAEYIFRLLPMSSQSQHQIDLCNRPVLMIQPDTVYLFNQGIQFDTHTSALVNRISWFIY